MKSFPLVLTGVLLAIGAVLNVVMPGFFFGMAPDMILTFMFLAILMFTNWKHVLVSGIAAGFLAGITTTFPAGFVPNFVERPFTAFIFFGLFILVRKNRSVVTATILTAVGTLLSGAIFIGFALIITGLPGGATFWALFTGVAVPSAGINAILMIVLHPIAKTFLRRSKMASADTNKAS